jgi:hypothetical protein
MMTAILGIGLFVVVVVTWFVIGVWIIKGAIEAHR